MDTKLLWFTLGISQLIYVLLLPVWLRLLAYLHPIVLVVIWMCLTGLATFIVYYVRKCTINISTFIFKILITLYSIGLLILLFFRPANQEYSQINYVPFKTIGGFLGGDSNFLIAFYNITANILLFVPYGVTALMFSRHLSWWRLVLIPAASIILIETMQYFTKRGGMDIDDLILNLLGVWIGYGLSSVIQRVVKVKS
ncbi:VanZ family protein [Neobacillus cucumis]|uniref:VanZ family protein n=1 Tax=Neobacillus cucumis TaxID=1740721 RepID=UPI00203EF932|nr:VanZ family protein [Neobacillus cucumis]MCM3726449.1 VanZ family protein [Neobacillus cucumis]